MKHKFTYNVVQTVEVEMNDAVFNEEFFKDFAKYMFPLEDCQELGEYIARQKVLYDGYQIEGVPGEGNGWSAKIVDDYVEEV